MKLINRVNKDSSNIKHLWVVDDTLVYIVFHKAPNDIYIYAPKKEAIDTLRINVNAAGVFIGSLGKFFHKHIAPHALYKLKG